MFTRSNDYLRLGNHESVTMRMMRSFFSWYFPLFPLFSSLPPVCTVYDTTSISKVQSCTFYDAVDSTLQHIRFLTLHTFLLLLGHVDLTSSTSRSDMM